MKIAEGKIRVCRITDSFPPPWLGLNPGPYELSKAQSHNDIDLEVITKYNKQAEDVDKHVKFKVHRIRAKSYIFEILAIYKFLQLHRENKFDIIHSHGTDAFLLLLFKNFLPRIPVVVSIHCVRKAQHKILRDNHPYKKIERMLHKSLFIEKLFFNISIRKHLNPRILKEKICFFNGDRLLPVSHGLASEVRDAYNLPGRKIQVIYNGIDFDSFIPTKPLIDKNYKSRDVGTILFVGVLNERKNVIDLLSAFIFVERQLPKVRLLLIGNGKLKKHLMEISESLGLVGKVRFIDSVHYDKIKTFYQDADIFVLPSYYEGLPKVLLEAMACAKPVVATNISGNNELIYNGLNGYLVDLNHASQMADRIVYLLRNKYIMAEMGVTGRNLIKRNFSWHQAAIKINKIYKELLACPQ